MILSFKVDLRVYDMLPYSADYGNISSWKRHWPVGLVSFGN